MAGQFPAGRGMRRGAAALIAAACTLTGLAVAAPDAGASPGPPPAPQPAGGAAPAPLAASVEFASPAELALLNQIDAARSGLANVTLKLAAADNLVANAQTQLLAEQQRLQQLQVQLAAATSRAELLADRMVDTRDNIRRRALASYVGDPQVRIANLTMQVAGTGDLGVTIGYLQVLVDTQRRDLRALESMRSEADATGQAIRSTTALIAAQQDNVAARRVAMDSARAQQEHVRGEAMHFAQEASALSGQLGGLKGDFAAQIAALDGASAGIAQLLRSFDAGQGNPVPAARGVFILPIPNAPVTSPFGPRLDPILGVVKVHAGIDVGGAEGTPIRAAADGVVVTAGVVEGYGNCTVIRHAEGLATLYGHQSQLLVVPGQQVHRGDIIGLVGHTGFATGPHLHFEVRVNGTPVDPIPYL